MKDIEEAIKWLKEYVEQDRIMRKNSTESDFDKYCEQHCKAIEVVLKQVEARGKRLERQYKLLVKQDKQIAQLEENSISKDKIREKINELEEQIIEIKGNIDNSIDEEKAYWKRERHDLIMQKYVLYKLLEEE